MGQGWTGDAPYAMSLLEKVAVVTGSGSSAVDPSRGIGTGSAIAELLARAGARVGQFQWSRLLSCRSHLRSHPRRGRRGTTPCD